MEKELKEITEQLNEKMAAFEKAQKAIELLVAGKVDQSKLDDLKAAAEKVGADCIKLNAEFEKMQLAQKSRDTRGASFEDMLAKAITPEQLKAVQGKGNGNVFKVDYNPLDLMKGDMTALTNLTYGTSFTSYASVVEATRLQGVAKAPDRNVGILDMVNVGQLAANQPRLTWVERSARTPGAAARAEAGIMGNSDFTYITKSCDVINISTYVKTTNESLEYWDQLLSEIRMELVPMLRRKLDDYLLTGNPSASPVELDGITNNAEAYTYAGLDDYVAEPTTADALYAALTQIVVNLYRPTGILLHPTDAAKMNLQKDKNNQFVLPPFMGANGLMIDGVPVNVNTGITAGYFLAGDFTKASVWFRKGIDIRIWDQNSTDPIYGLKTITADMSVAFKVPTVNHDAFVYDQISDVVALIAK